VLLFFGVNANESDSLAYTMATLRGLSLTDS
jgi:hypothetical protein